METISNIFWRNDSDNALQIWLMDGNKVAKRVPVLAENGNHEFAILPWRIIGVGDFNRDGNTDILWRNDSDSALQIWLMDGNKVAKRVPVLAENGNHEFAILPWRIVGTGSIPAQDTIAALSMAKFYHDTGGAFGPLGVPLNAPHRISGTSYIQEFQLGNLHLNDIAGTVTGETTYEAEVTLAAVKCFGTQDNGTDETYVVMSLVTVDPNNPGMPVATQRTVIQDGVNGGDTIFKNAIVIQQKISGTSGIMVHLAVWDHESGDADKLRNDINEVLQDGASKAASALAGGDLGGQGGFVGDIINFEVGGVKPFKLLTLSLAGLIAGALADDLIGEHVFVIPPGNIIDLAEQGNFNRSIRPNGPALDFDVQFNWPPNPQDEFLFSDGHGSYKVFLKVKGIKKVRPIDPPLPLRR